MNPSVQTVEAAIRARQWVRARRQRLGREVTPEELEAYVDSQLRYKQVDHRYVMECASPALLPRREGI